MNNLLTEVSEQCAVTVEQIEDIYPCTPLQEGLFAVSMHQQQAYVFRQVFRLGLIDIDQFKQAWQTAAEMVSILRTVIVSAQGSRFLQVVLRKKLEWVKGTSLDAYLDADKCVPIQQGQPLSRYAVIESRPSERYFVWTSHHSAYDGHTLRKLYELVAAIYSHQPLPKIAPFKSFVKHLGATDPSKAKLFWQSQLQGNIGPGFPKLLDPEYQPQPTERLLYRLQVPRIALPVTISTMLRVAWALVLAKHTDTPDVIFGVTLSGRTAPVADVAEVAGPTITTVPIRLNLDPQLTIGEVLLAAQQQASAMITFEHTGLQNIQKLVSKSLPDLRHLFVVQLPQEEDNQADAIMPGLEPYMTDSQAFDSYPLNVLCTTGLDQSGAAKIEVRFDETVIPTHLVKTLLQQFDHVISRLGQLVDLPIGEVEVVHPSDIAQIRDWNRTIPEAQHSCIHELVHEQMNRQPNALAISSWDGNLTYVELDALATKLCQYLVSLGVGPEVMVGLCFDKSKWAIVVMLGVLKAGGTIVSLGVQQPISRIKGIIQDIAARMILVGPEHLDRFSTFDCQIVSIIPELFSHLPDTTEPDDSSRIPAITKPSNAAIVIFTSGSTGTPKGVVLSHEALCTSIKAHGQAFGIGPETKALQFSAYTFDVSIQEIFTTLCFGGRICIISEDDRINNLVGAINKTGANFASLTSTVANLLQPNEVPLLKTLVLLGEPVRPAVVDSWANHAKVLNAYGPSECSIHSTVGLPLTQEAQVSNIGFPLSCRLWVVESSDYNKLCPIGTLGELLIEGPIQARGYLNDPEKTERAFINDPAWMKKYDFNSSGRRFYRTGDLVQQNPDGSLLHFGRKDTQIKINGQRVEPGEIENKLTQHEQIADAVVLYPKSGPCQSRLVGLLALRDLESGTVQGLEIQALGPEGNDARVSSIISSSREHLSHHVMSYMVPTTWIVLTTMPLTATGKMDRLKLQSWLESVDHETFLAIAHKAPGVQSREPVSEEELKLRDVFIEVMGLQEAEIVLESSFISLGGDSVAAMQVVSRCRQIGVSMSVVDILRSKTIAELAAIIQSQRNGATSGKLPLQIEEMVDWHTEAALSLGMHDLAVASAAKVRDKPIEILLTGSTGFLGNRILQKLVSSQDVSRIHCVAVRLEGQGTSRMNPVQSEKVITYTGDLELPRLGLSDDEYRLLETCDAIIHCGAQVSYVQAYEALRGSNVQSTKELAQLALTYGIPIHFVSTIGVTRLSKQDTAGEGSVALYLPDDRGSGYTASGYVASKWVSEVFLENVSREFGLPVHIHRPSSIIGPGAPSMDIVNNLLQFSRKMRVAPKFTGWKGHVDAVEVDAVAANIVSSVMEPLRQSSKPSPMGVRYIHESGQLVLPFDGVKQYMEREEGAEFQTVSTSEWVQLALKNGMNELVAEYLNSVEQDGDLPSMPLFETSRRYTRVNAQVAVHGTENAEGK
jgi:amino acid adenylation domain-containing protein/thioester reductase-like protein